jgi:hypothetical protein
MVRPFEEESMNALKKRREDTGKSRRTAKLGSSLEKSLLTYVCAAATCVGLSAAAKSAEAEVVYTPADTVIPVNGGFVSLDLNHDGIDDFAFWNQRTTTSTGSHATSLNLYAGCFPSGSVCQNQKNEIWGRGAILRRFASALQSGVSVGPDRSYFQQAPRLRFGLPSPVAVMARLVVDYSYLGNLAQSFTSGQWLHTTHRYLGLQFVIDGKLHYGWARVAVTQKELSGFTATLTGYAYETIPEKPIVTGATKEKDASTLEPASLGRLAQGARGIPAWR